MEKKIAIIIGAGPAGLTAAYELLEKDKTIQPTVFELSGEIGGISKTVNYKGNRMDMGGHRFFSKSDTVMNWWLRILPIENASSNDEKKLQITYQNQNRDIFVSDSVDPQRSDNVMLVRERLSRIFFMRKFFDYPLQLNIKTLKNLGLTRLLKAGMSYVKSRLFPINPEKSLEDFFINRFGKELYLTFFKDYTEKVWGVPCENIDPEWGAQRIKGLSISKALLHTIKQMLPQKKSISQKDVETSLIQRFLYPKFGPGQMWEEVAKRITDRGGEIHMYHQVVGLYHEDGKIIDVVVRNNKSGEKKTYKADYIISTMPVKELVESLQPAPPENVCAIAKGLLYRDFITVGLLVKKLKISSSQETVSDNWIYIQERDVKIGRLQVFNNWSPYLVTDPNKTWLGLEYFCTEGDELWSMADDEFMEFAGQELAKIGIIDTTDILDQTIVRVKKAYPAYFGTYKDFDQIREYIDHITNLFLVGRNGMHKYNNQDHSMLTAMAAVENITKGVPTKDNIWDINSEQEYHEEKR